jgi:cytochrome c-type biogenesis protein CcmH
MRKFLKNLFWIIFFSTSSFIIYGMTINTYPFINIMQQQRFQNLISELRCLVCQNQSLAESNAPLAQDLKNIVYEQIQAGFTDQQIKDYLVARYGDYILFKPRLNQATFILWLGPLLFLCGAFGVMYISIRRQARSQYIILDVHTEEQSNATLPSKVSGSCGQ